VTQLITGRSFCTNGHKTVHEVGGRVAIQERHDQAEEERRKKHVEGGPPRHVYDYKGPVCKERESRSAGFMHVNTVQGGPKNGYSVLFLG